MDDQSTELPRWIKVERLAEDILDVGTRQANVLQDVIVQILQDSELPTRPPVAEPAPKHGEGLAAVQHFRLIEDVFAHFWILSRGAMPLR